MKPWYDNAQAIATRIERDGLQALHELAVTRRDAGYRRHERMSDLVVLGRFCLDSCGNFILIRDHAPADVMRHKVPIVMTREDSAKVSPWGGTMWTPPGPHERCSLCEEGWALHDAHECYWDSQPPHPVHRACKRLSVIQGGLTELNRIVDSAGVSTSDRILIPSRYHDDDLYFEPWMRLDTPQGRLTIGRRKRVWQIEWKNSAIDVPPEEFADEAVTKTAGFIHAWTEDKAVDYLQRIWKHAPKGES